MTSWFVCTIALDSSIFIVSTVVLSKTQTGALKERCLGANAGHIIQPNWPCSRSRERTNSQPKPRHLVSPHQFLHFGKFVSVYIYICIASKYTVLSVFSWKLSTIYGQNNGRYKRRQCMASGRYYQDIIIQKKLHRIQTLCFLRMDSAHLEAIYYVNISYKHLFSHFFLS